MRSISIRDLIEILGPSKEEFDFEESKNSGIETETPTGSAGVSSAIDIFVVNDLDDTEVQDRSSVRQQGLKATTNDCDDSIIAEQFVGTSMVKYGIHQSIRTILAGVNDRLGPVKEGLE